MAPGDSSRQLAEREGGIAAAQSRYLVEPNVKSGQASWHPHTLFLIGNILPGARDR